MTTTLDHPDTLTDLKMPASVASMPLAWYCPLKGKDALAGYRVWDGTPTMPRGLCVARIERRDESYRVELRDPSGCWYEIARFPYDLDSGPSDARRRAIECAEWHEGEMFNMWQPDPRTTTLARADGAS